MQRGQRVVIAGTVCTTSLFANFEFVEMVGFCTIMMKFGAFTKAHRVL